MAEQSDIERVRSEFHLEHQSLRFSSPLLAALAARSATDVDILELALHVPEGQPAAMFIMLAAQFLLLQHRAASLARYFPSLTTDPRPPQEAFADFREFCLFHRQELVRIVTTRTLNMNLVERSTYVLRALAYLAALDSRPATLIEVGCSAGLTLLFDRYAYEYAPTCRLGPQDSSVKLKCMTLGDSGMSITPFSMPTYERRIGIDLVPVSPALSKDRLWMEAMLPPEWDAERSRLRAALDIRASSPLEIVIADAVEALPQLLRSIEGPVHLLASHVLRQLGDAAAARLDDVLREASLRHPVDRIDVDAISRESSVGARERLLALTRAGFPLTLKSMPSSLRHTRYRCGNAQTHDLGEADGLGQWISWSA